MYIVINGVETFMGRFATREDAESFIDAQLPGEYELFLTVDHFTVTAEAPVPDIGELGGEG